MLTHAVTTQQELYISFLELPQQMTTKWWLKTTETYSLKVLGIRSLKSRHYQGPASSKDSRGKSFLASLSFT